MEVPTLRLRLDIRARCDPWRLGNVVRVQMYVYIQRIAGSNPRHGVRLLCYLCKNQSALRMLHLMKINALTVVK
jgi:hypothetical protein